jgi:Cellulose binding domain
MATRTAGRHRSTKSWSPPPPPSLLLVDYLESGQFRGRPARPPGFRLGRLPSPARPPSPARQGPPVRPERATRRALWARPERASRYGGRGVSVSRYGGRGVSVSRPSVNWRMAVPAVLAGVAVAVAIGGYTLLRSPGTGGRHGTPKLTPPPALALPPSGASASPATPTPAPSRRHVAARQPAGFRPPPAPATSAAPSVAPAAAKPHSPAVVVRYLVTSQGPGGFQGEVQVTNNGAQAISDWRIVIALPSDQVLSFSNAAGFFSDGILLLQPGPGAQPVQPGGGTLSVFFVAEGGQTVPQACAFNETVCG